jgi:hypothetical protein
VILIAVTPPAPSPALAEAMVDACTEAARVERCAVDDKTEQPDATVVWASGSVVRVELAPKSDGGPSRFRELSFRSRDRELDRWHSIGLVVAALATDSPMPSGAEEFPATPPPPPPAADSPRGSAAALWMSGGAALGTGLEPGPPRLGGWARVSYLPRATSLFVSVGADALVASRGEDNVRPTWLDLTAGVGVKLDILRLDLAVRPQVDVVVERVAADVIDAGETASGSRFVAGLSARIDVVWPARSPVALVGGFLGSWLTGGTAIRVRERNVASFPAANYAFAAGAQVSFGP